MSDLMAADGVEDGLRCQVIQLHKGAGEEGKPDVHRHQTENMVEGQEGQKLQLAFVMLLDLLALSNNVEAVIHLMVKFLSGVGAKL